MYPGLQDGKYPYVGQGPCGPAECDNAAKAAPQATDQREVGKHDIQAGPPAGNTSTRLANTKLFDLSGRNWRWRKCGYGDSLWPPVPSGVSGHVDIYTAGEARSRSAR